MPDLQCSRSCKDYSRINCTSSDRADLQEVWRHLGHCLWTSTSAQYSGRRGCNLGAKGTYRPTSTADRTISFILKNGVALYGGFAGNETALDQRDPVNNLTILSGDIGSTSSRYDNSYHVVVSSGTDSATILDGVTITGGQSDGTAPHDKGAGLLNIGGSPTLNNLTISANHTGYAYGDGAGIIAPAIRP